MAWVPRAAHPFLAGNPAYEGVSGTVIWRKAGGVMGMWVGAAALYKSGQLFPIMMLLWLWDAVGLGVQSAFPSNPFRFPGWKWAIDHGKSYSSKGMHHEKSQASLNVAMQMHVFKEGLHWSSRTIAAKWNFSCFTVLVQQHYNLTLSRF